MARHLEHRMRVGAYCGYQWGTGRNALGRRPEDGGAPLQRAHIGAQCRPQPSGLSRGSPQAPLSGSNAVHCPPAGAVSPVPSVAATRPVAPPPCSFVGPRTAVCAQCHAGGGPQLPNGSDRGGGGGGGAISGRTTQYPWAYAIHKGELPPQGPASPVSEGAAAGPVAGLGIVAVCGTHSPSGSAGHGAEGGTVQRVQATRRLHCRGRSGPRSLSCPVPTAQAPPSKTEGDGLTARRCSCNGGSARGYRPHEGGGASSPITAPHNADQLVGCTGPRQQRHDAG